MKVYWTPGAQARLLEIQAYLKGHAPLVARTVPIGLARRALELGHSPAMGRLLARYAPAEVRELLERPYRLIYRVTATQVDILTVLHYRQLMPSDLTDLQR
ncbi:type II toxin-antitoxin system RelE/ParE family toxin [Xanthomonas campestris pv. badrii]|uniref:Type II toxin-antitoxin system RelE/ParE family toxin n=1 Tax=Xanthomonas campestris pv. badrii TaxID=149696 RepID=A0A7Z2ZI15_XANCA|nr:type II toxin-antitoxin system RelE/ParE family toxin [Xanthomonas campestris]QJD68637.1 type II toxin-antitoxin system RelE/ParE family toxin [Xanthomonas campestris pv. badrii]